MQSKRIGRFSVICYNAKKLFSSQTRAFSSKDDDVIFREVGNSGIIILNRPKTMNALNSYILENMCSVLKDWETEKRLVVVKSANNNVFSAGVDIKSIVLSLNNKFGLDHSTELVRKMYTMEHLISTYKKPYISIINGITMGGGAGISGLGKYRIATENTLFATPEVSIGLHVNVGCSYFLSRLEGKLGMFLALTGYRLKGADVLYTGIATHYVPSDKIEAVTNELLLEKSNIDATLEPYLPRNLNGEFSLSPHLDLINECFSASTVEEMIKRLQEKNSKFAQTLLKLLSKMSPTALKVTKKVIEDASKKSVAETLITDFRLDCKTSKKSHDFAEGVRASLIEKDNKPMWNPRSLEEVSDDFVNEQFQPLPPNLEFILPRL